MVLTREQALDCCQTDDLIGIGMEADALRRKLHPEGVVTYVIDRPISFPSPSLQPSLEARLAEAVDLGATGIVLRSPAAPADPDALASITQTLTAIRQHCPSLWLHGLSATTVVALAATAGTSVEETLRRLQAAGLCSLSGADAGILATAAHTDAVHSQPPRCSTADWLAVHRTAHRLGLPSTTVMLFGAGETLEHRVDHLEAIHRLQEETGGFLAFLPTAFQPAAAGVRGFEEATAVEYLRTLAVSRLFLDNVPNIEADWPTQGLKVLQMAIRFGANDVGSTMPGTATSPEALTTPDGTTEEDLRRVIRGAGFRPAHRDPAYRTLFLD